MSFSLGTGGDGFDGFGGVGEGEGGPCFSV